MKAVSMTLKSHIRNHDLWIISRLVVVNQGKINGLSPIEQALSQRVQGVKDSRIRVILHRTGG